MLEQDKFEFDIANLRQDFSIENMTITNADIALLKRYHDKEITMSEMINLIIEETAL